ncbi:MAG: APC family permease [Parasphingorhabdus sp.]|uniref:APC family permease n=3 Tax=Parasphingorhabdus sp. TaxID=2709688 RepID=UPI00329A3806
MSEALKPPRVLGTVGASLLNLNGMIGAGIFALPALLYVGLGNFAPFAILLFAIPTICLAAACAKLSTVFDQSGGAQLYVETALGKFTGFQVGWFVICASSAGRAANFHVLVSYLAALFPVFDGPIARPITIIACIAFMTIMSVIGTKRSIGGVWVGTIFKLAPLVLLCVVGIGMNGVPSDVELPSFSGLESVALLIAYAFSGFGTSIATAGETKDPRTTVFRSVIMAIVGVALFYAVVQWAYIAIAPETGNADIPLAVAAQKLFGYWGSVMISIAAVFSIATNQLCGFIVFPRVLFGMGERNLLPRFFAHVSPRFLTPDYAILSYGLFVATIAITGSFATLATLLVAVEQIIFALILLSFGVLWKSNFRELRDATGSRWLVILPVAVAMVAWMSWQVPATAILSTMVMIAIGTILYWLAKYRVSRQLPKVAQT